MGFEGKTKTILLVDDDETVRQFTSASLRKAKFNVITAGSGEEALAIYTERRKEIDLVVTDMVMPGLFGDQLAARLWQIEPGLPLLFMSGNSPQTLEPEVTLEPGINFLQKPFSIVELLDIIRARLARADSSAGAKATSTPR